LTVFTATDVVVSTAVTAVEQLCVKIIKRSNKKNFFIKVVI
jgi:hypothetical protein